MKFAPHVAVLTILAMMIPSASADGTEVYHLCVWHNATIPPPPGFCAWGDPANIGGDCEKFEAGASCKVTDKMLSVCEHPDFSACELNEICRVWKPPVQGIQGSKGVCEQKE